MTSPSFVNPLAPRSTGVRAKSGLIKNWVRTTRRVDDETVISVTELACRDDGCPDIETVIGILEPGKPIATLRIHKSILELEEKDVDSAAESL